MCIIIHVCDTTHCHKTGRHAAHQSCVWINYMKLKEETMSKVTTNMSKVVGIQTEIDVESVSEAFLEHRS